MAEHLQRPGDYEDWSHQEGGQPVQCRFGRVQNGFLYGFVRAHSPSWLVHGLCLFWVPSVVQAECVLMQGSASITVQPSLAFSKSQSPHMPSWDSRDLHTLLTL